MRLPLWRNANEHRVENSHYHADDQSQVSPLKTSNFGRPPLVKCVLRRLIFFVPSHLPRPRCVTAAQQMLRWHPAADTLTEDDDTLQVAPARLASPSWHERKLRPFSPRRTLKEYTQTERWFFFSSLILSERVCQLLRGGSGISCKACFQAVLCVPA